MDAIEKLTVLDNIPESFFHQTSESVHQVFPGPTVIHLKGEKSEPLLVSTLLHGNETSGLIAIQGFLRDYINQTLPRDLILFIGNPKAARLGVRALDNQPDYNRVWPGFEGEQNAFSEIMQAVYDYAEAQQIFAAVDIHNTSGRNPMYSCINYLDNRFIYLASLFDEKIVFFTRPKGVCSMALGQLAPAITVECSKPSPTSELAVREFLHRLITLAVIEDSNEVVNRVNIFHTVASVKVKSQVPIAFKSAYSGIEFPHDLDLMNFKIWPQGTRIAHVHQDEMPVIAYDENGQDVTERYFHLQSGVLKLSKKLMPSMFTLDESIIRQDCLGYLMEQLAHNG